MSLKIFHQNLHQIKKPHQKDVREDLQILTSPFVLNNKDLFIGVHKRWVLF